MQCTIYDAEELKKKHRIKKERVVVVARFEKRLVLAQNAEKWALPETTPVRGESMEETAQRALGAAMGEAVFSVKLLCGFTVTKPDGGEEGGYAFLADVQEWPDGADEGVQAFDHPPEALEEAALVYGLKRWSWPFFLKGEILPADF